MSDAREQDLTAEIDTLENELAACRKKMAEARQDHNRCAAVFNRMLDSYYRVDLQGNVLWTSPSAAAMLGYDAVDEMIGLNLARDFYADPAQREAFLARLARDGKVQDYKVVLKKRDGSLIEVSTNSYFIRDDTGEITGVEGICRDITEQESYRRALEAEKEKVRQYLDIAGVMLAALNARGEITLINRKGCEILAVTEGEALGKNWFKHYLPPRVVDEVRGVFDKIMAAGNIGPYQYMENPVLTSHGEEKIIAFHNAVIHDSEGNIAGTLFSGEDVTHRRHAEEEKAMLENRLRQTYKMEAIGTMAGGIAHDFNNILAVILGNADMALGGIPEGHVARHNIEQVIEASNRAKDLVRQILAFSRKENLKLTPIRPHLMAEETLKLLRSTTPATVSININISSECPTILADPTQFHQLLMNLFANAVQAMEEKGEITVVLQEVKLDGEALRNVAAKGPGQYVRLAVADTGAGMDKKTMERAFDPFYTTKGVGKGTGMGLAVVHGIVKSHGAAITVDSEPGKGTTFAVYFPVIMETEVRKIKRSETLPRGTERILFIDDEEMIASLARRQLEAQGYQVTTATDPTAALAMFRTAPEKFDLIITDQSMPVMSGVELVAEFLKVRPDIPIILCTGYSTKISAETAPQLGVKAFCQKPCDRKLLIETVRRVLDAQKT
jgi:PAS domain S-box-containing protein